jgi:PadR family transcriptional regulator PadR
MKTRDQRDLFPGALEMMVLRILQAGPLHGYALAQAIKRNSSDLLHVEEGSLYPALQRMLNAAWLKAEWGLSSRNRRVRIYRLTAKGRKQLEIKVSSFERMLEGIQLVMKSSADGAS